MEAERLTGVVSHHGEGPCWSASWGGLRFVDLLAGDLLTLTSDGVARLPSGHAMATFVYPTRSGGYVMGTRTGIGVAPSADSPARQVLTLIAGEEGRMNDGTVLPDGTLLAGTMSLDGSYTGSLYSVHADGSVHPQLRAIACSNGIGVAPDARTMYYVDTGVGRIDRCELAATGDGVVITGRRPFARPDEGLPDGLTVDADGTVWVAVWGGARVNAYSPAGELVAVVAVGARQVSSCAFGGDDLGTLFITTSRQGLGEGDDPEAGSLYAVRTGSSGLPVVPFDSAHFSVNT